MFQNSLGLTYFTRSTVGLSHFRGRKLHHKFCDLISLLCECDNVTEANIALFFPLLKFHEWKAILPVKYWKKQIQFTIQEWEIFNPKFTLWDRNMSGYTIIFLLNSVIGWVLSTNYLSFKFCNWLHLINKLSFF